MRKEYNIKKLKNKRRGILPDSEKSISVYGYLKDTVTIKGDIISLSIDEKWEWNMVKK